MDLLTDILKYYCRISIRYIKMFTGAVSFIYFHFQNFSACCWFDFLIQEKSSGFGFFTFIQDFIFISFSELFVFRWFDFLIQERSSRFHFFSFIFWIFLCLVDLISWSNQKVQEFIYLFLFPELFCVWLIWFLIKEKSSGSHFLISFPDLFSYENLYLSNHIIWHSKIY